MPRFNIFVREDDLKLWEAIEDRPRWVHDALRATGKDYPKAVKERKEIEALITNPVDYDLGGSTDPECPRHHVRMSLCRHKH